MTRRGSSLGGALLLLVSVVVGGGCGSSSDGYVNPNVDFGFMERAAVVPFQNLSRDMLADQRVKSVFLMELLKRDVLEIVDPGETVAVMTALKLPVGQPLTPEQAVKLGEALEVQALFFGIVEEYGLSQVDRRRGPEVTAVFGLVETETGSVVWRAQVNETGGSAWKRLFGGSTDGLYEVSQKAVNKALGTLF